MLRRFINFIPIIVLILQYALGVSAAKYLGARFDGAAAFIGFLWLIIVYLGAQILAYPFSENFQISSRRLPKPFRDKPQAFVILLAAFVFMIAISISIFQIQQAGSAAFLLVFQALIAFYFVFESIPPLQIKKTIFSELGFAVILGVLVPALSFYLQSDEIHRVLAMVSFPSVFLLFSVRVILGLESFIPDKKAQVKSFLHSVGWEAGIFWQNVSLLTSYLLLAAAVYFQLAFALAWPVFLTLILAFYVILQLRRIQQGIKPNWGTLIFSSFLVYFWFVYLLFFGMVLR